MSRLVLVRHGQARAFENDSDRLSELGEQQSRTLGDWFRAQGLTFNEGYCGTLIRQRRTAELMGFDAVVQDPAWNEYDAGGVLKLVNQDARLASMAEEAARFRGTPDANRYFQRMFEPLMQSWVRGELTADDVESWAAFQQRVRGAFERIVNGEGSGRNVLVVTSGGVIATVVQIALQAPSEKALELNWRMRNASITELLFAKGRVSLDMFNATPHLLPSTVTYR